MPIRVPDNLPALDDLEAEGVDLIASGQATKQDIRPLRLLMLNLMPTKKATEIQFARLFGCSPLQVELILMTTESYTPRNTEPAYLRRFYRRLSDVEDEYFDALIVTGAPIETKPFEEVSYWNELVDILNWSKTHCFRRLGICWGAQALLYHFHNLPKYQMDTKFFGIYNHSITSNSGTSDSGTSDSGRSHSGRSYSGRLMHGFTTTFPMPVSRFTMNKKQDILDRGLDILAESDEIGVGMVRDKSTGDLFVLNHLEYDAETLKAEYVRDKQEGLDPPIPKNYFPEDKPELAPQNYWRPFAYLLCANWLNDLYQDTMFDLTQLQDDKHL